jgi:hypothetical protein
LGLGEYNKDDLYVDISIDEETGQPHFELTDLGNAELNAYSVDVFKISTEHITKNTLVTKIEVDEKIHKETYDKVYEMLIYNSLIIIIRFIYSIKNPRKINKMIAKFEKSFGEDGGTFDSSLLDEIYSYALQNNVLDLVSLKKELRDALSSHFEKCFNIYKKHTYLQRHLFKSYEKQPIRHFFTSLYVLNLSMQTLIFLLQKLSILK